MRVSNWRGAGLNPSWGSNLTTASGSEEVSVVTFVNAPRRGSHHTMFDRGIYIENIVQYLSLLGN